jgi:hypothetical protein
MNAAIPDQAGFRQEAFHLAANTETNARLDYLKLYPRLANPQDLFSNNFIPEAKLTHSGGILT